MEALTQQQALASLIVNFQTNTLKAGRDKFSAGFLRGRKECLERYWLNFQEQHAALSVIQDLQGETYFTENRSSTVELQYTSALGFLYDEAKLVPATVRPEEPALGQRRARLPQITLPTFTGRAEEWESFRDLFRSLIHLDNELNGVQKLHYLKTSVQREAKTALDGIATTEANYAVAWQQLLDRYDNDVLLAQWHMSALAAMRPLKDESSAGLQGLHDQVIRSHDALKALNRPVAHWGDWFVFFATKAMDASTRKEWEKTMRATDNGATYDSLIKFLLSLIQTLRTLEVSRPSRE